ncbi:MAG: hypothetical protein MUC36_00265 [Planctomycetes bacterium]|jgi:hypothetical protein|nr:hypothetical protein [Planctomycetota bacterium]
MSNAILIRSMTWRTAISSSLMAVCLPAQVQINPVFTFAATAHVAGPVETVHDFGLRPCPADPWAFPDTIATAFRSADGKVHLRFGHGGTSCNQLAIGTAEMIGADFNTLRLSCASSFPISYDPNPANYNDGEWISSYWTANGTTVHALVHMEFHGECIGCVGQPRSITYAVSNDGGQSFLQAPAGAKMVATNPGKFRCTGNPVGMEGVSNIVQHPTDGNWYSMFRFGTFLRPPAWTAPNQIGWGRTSVMRTGNLADTTSWRAWGGHTVFPGAPASLPLPPGSGQFDISFVDPYAFPGSVPNANQHIPWPLSYGAPPYIISQLAIPSTPASELYTYDPFAFVYNTDLGVFVSIGRGVNSSVTMGGIYYAFSSNLVSWTKPRLLDPSLEWPATSTGPDSLQYPSFIDHGSSRRSFDWSDNTCHVYFTTVAPAGSFQNRVLKRVPIVFTTP